MRVPVARPVAGDEAADLVEPGDAGRGQAAEVIAAVVQVRLEFAERATEARRDLRQHAPREVFPAIPGRIPRGEDRRVEPLGMPMTVPSERPDIVRGDDPEGAGRRGPAEDEDTAEERELIRGQRQRAAAELLADLGEGSGLDDTAGESSPHEAARGRGREEPAGVGLVDIRSDGTDEPGDEVAAGSGSAFGDGRDDRHPAFDEDPEERPELCIEDAGADEVDERRRLRGGHPCRVRRNARSLDTYYPGRSRRPSAGRRSTEVDVPTQPEHTTPHPRRTILAGALGAIVAAVAGAFGRPSAVRAGIDGDVVLGASNTTTSTTSIANNTDGDTVLLVSSTAGGVAIQASSNSQPAVLATSGSHGGILGQTGAAAKSGVFGRNTGDGPGVSGTSGAGAIPQPPKTGVYGFANQDASAAGVVGESDLGIGAYGVSTTGPGVRGDTSSAQGVVGIAGVIPDTLPTGVGVVGISSNAAGVVGQSIYDSGVYGESVGYVGVKGFSETDSGVRGNSVSGTGVWGGASAESGGTRGVFGASLSPGGTGVQGYSGSQALPSAAPNTGVFGRADRNSGSRGVFGSTNSGRGVFGTATTGQGVRGYTTGTTGTAGYFSTPVDGGSSLHKGIALVADGRVKFPNCVGVKAFTAGATSVVVTPGIDLTSTSAAIATITGPSVGVSVVRTSVNATANTFTIFLSGPATGAGKVAWHVFG